MVYVAFFLSLYVKVNYGGKIYKLDLEKYVEGVVSQEIPTNWPDEVIKAQAVVSRSYAIYITQVEKKPFILADTKHQLWRENTEKRISELVRETKGYILTFSDGTPAPGFFHSTCGGRTENAWEIWGGDPHFKEIISVKCTKCYDSPLFFWKKEMSLKELAKYSTEDPDPIYKKILGDVDKIIWAEKSSSGRVLKLIFTNTMKVIYYRNIRDILPSNFFEFEIVGDKIIFYGRGWGHGVGMCQWGAKKLAEEGFSWKQIIKFYFPKLRLKKIY